MGDRRSGSTIHLSRASADRPSRVALAGERCRRAPAFASEPRTFALHRKQSTVYAKESPRIHMNFGFMGRSLSEGSLALAKGKKKYTSVVAGRPPPSRN